MKPLCTISIDSPREGYPRSCAAVKRGGSFLLEHYVFGLEPLEHRLVLRRSVIIPVFGRQRRVETHRDQPSAVGQDHEVPRLRLSHDAVHHRPVLEAVLEDIGRLMRGRVLLEPLQLLPIQRDPQAGALRHAILVDGENQWAQGHCTPTGNPAVYSQSCSRAISEDGVYVCIRI